MFTLTYPQLEYLVEVYAKINHLPSGSRMEGYGLKPIEVDLDVPGVTARFTEEDGVYLLEFTDVEPSKADLMRWAKANLNQYRVDHKIQFIKDLRDAFRTDTYVPGLKDCKDAVEWAIDVHWTPPSATEEALRRLREKLGQGPIFGDELSEEVAYARSREAQAERGIWFGAPGPMDEEPPF